MDSVCTAHHVVERTPRPPLPSLGGSYALLLHLNSPTLLRIGYMGLIPLLPGDYVYTGSARGPGGLAARVGRHLRLPEMRRARWHIDHLTAIAPPLALVARVHGDEERYECKWAALLARQPGISRPVPRFGSSDCACPSHLIRWPAPLTPEELRDFLEQAPYT
ncbi:MAG: GIY-YIG nuclease family protein [Anaerolineae bacterium]|nr:GIY-YIG nuclease family protein [Anaerolineae bacterium]